MAEYTNIDPNNPPAPQTKKIWKTFFILVGITGVEFLFAFFFPKEMRTMLITIYVLLTIVKAFFIVSEFMHLGHEVKGLIYSVVMPFVFVLWLVLALILEANSAYYSKFDYNNQNIKSTETVDSIPADRVSEGED